jgi:hypothetical protein
LTGEREWSGAKLDDNKKRGLLLIDSLYGEGTLRPRTKGLGWVSLMHAPQRRKADKAVKGGSHPAYSRDLQELKGLFNRKSSSLGWYYIGMNLQGS